MGVFCSFPGHVLSYSPEAGLRTISVQMPRAVATKAGYPFWLLLLTCTMFPVPFGVVDLKEIKSSPSIPVHCLSLTLRPPSRSRAGRGLHMNLRHFMWAHVQVTSASMMCIVRVCGDTGIMSESLGAALAAGVGVAPCPLQKKLMIFTQRLGHT